MPVVRCICAMGCHRCHGGWRHVDEIKRDHGPGFTIGDVTERFRGTGSFISGTMWFMIICMLAMVGLSKACEVVHDFKEAMHEPEGGHR